MMGGLTEDSIDQMPLIFIRNVQELNTPVYGHIILVRHIVQYKCFILKVCRILLKVCRTVHVVNSIITLIIFCFIYYHKPGGNDQGNAQSERNSHSKNRGVKNLIDNYVQSVKKA